MIASTAYAGMFKDTIAFTMHHVVSEMTKTKKAKIDGLKKHQQQQREEVDDQRTEERQTPS
jgi:hypothetical protein